MNMFENLRLQLNNLREITAYIENNRNISNLATSLLSESYYPRRIEVISEIISNIKIEIDITYKYEIPNNILALRSNVIALVDVTKDLHSRIRNKNDNLVRKYNYEIIQILDRL